MRRLTSGALALLAALVAAPARGHDVYVSIDNHTDYGWNDTVAHYEAAMLSELDFYLAQIDLTAGNRPSEQARFNADCWYYLYLYEQSRSTADFQRLIDAMTSRHVTVPLNPFVTLYGALPTEAAIRAGYYPGQIERRFGVSFAAAQDIENQTNPWGIASIWAASRVRYTWKGICGCATQAPYNNRIHEVFRWEGPDGQQLLMKWYQLASNDSWGGYAEARANRSAAGIQATIDHFRPRSPFVPLSGLFGVGWDDVNYRSTELVGLAQSWNAAHAGGDQVIVSDQIDYFEDVESQPVTLPVLRGGWGNDWDLWPAALSERTAITRRAVEQLRTAEALSAIVQAHDASYWRPRQVDLELGWLDYHKYYEHTWGAAGSVPLASVEDNKKGWAANFANAVQNIDAIATGRAAALFQTPSNEDRFAVFNPLAFERTDAADLPVSGSGPYVVHDVESGAEVPSQVISRSGGVFLRVLVSNVPSLGFRVYRYAPGAPQAFPQAATVSGATLESDRYRVTLGGRGQLTSAFDKAAGRELAGTVLNDFGSGTAGTPIVESAGPVSVTLAVDVGGTPPRRVRVTLIKDGDRIELQDELLANYRSLGTYRFAVNEASPALHFEEVGAIARPGLTVQGGDFLAGTRSDFMTLNHFVSFSEPSYTITLSNWDAFAMKVGNSSPTAFDLTRPEVSVLVTGNPAGSDFTDQGADARFLHRFAVQGAAAGYSGARAMRMSLAHQNPLRALALGRGQAGPLSAPSGSFLSSSAPNVAIMAFKPTEENDRGLLVRLWELDGTATTTTLDVSGFAPTQAFETTLIETDRAPAPLAGGRMTVSIGANELKAFRFLPSRSQTTTDGGAPEPDAGTGEADAGDSQPPNGCHCAMTGSGTALWALFLLIAGAALGRRGTGARG